MTVAAMSLDDAPPAHMRIERRTRTLRTVDGPFRGDDASEDVLILRWRTQPYRSGPLALAAISSLLAAVALGASGHLAFGGYALAAAVPCALGVVGDRRHVEVAATGITVFTPCDGRRPVAVSARGLRALALEEPRGEHTRFRLIARMNEGPAIPLLDTLHRREAVAAVRAIAGFLGAPVDGAA